MSAMRKQPMWLMSQAIICFISLVEFRRSSTHCSPDNHWLFFVVVEIHGHGTVLYVSSMEPVHSNRHDCLLCNEYLLV